MTKADRQKREEEKAQREKLGMGTALSMHQQPNGYGGMAQLASASNMGTTPMIFNN
jgi:hypothetical protein